jgi:hypothetical protein
MPPLPSNNSTNQHVNRPSTGSVTGENAYLKKRQNPSVRKTSGRKAAKIRDNMTQDINDFLSRIQTDYEFYLVFRQNPQAALGPYRLSAQERAVLSEAGVDVGNPQLPLSARLLNTIKTFGGAPSCKICPIRFLSLELSDFDAAVAVARPEVKQSLAQLHDAGSVDDRLAVLETLMKYVGYA